MSTRRCIPLAVALGAAFGAAPALAQIYAGTTGSGAVVLSNFQTDQTPQMVIAPPPAPTPALPVGSEPLAAAMVPATSSVPTGTAPAAARIEKLKPMIQKIAAETSVPPQLLHAVIAVESGYDERAVSPKGAQGLMQLMPRTAQRFGVRNAFDPLDNVRGGALYLRWLLNYFNGDVRLALAGYNAGESEVVRYGYRIPPYRETLAYVPKVLAHLNRAS